MISGFLFFIGCVGLMLIAEFAPLPKRSQNTKIKKPKRSYKPIVIESSNYTTDSTSFHVVYSGDCEPVGIGNSNAVIVEEIDESKYYRER